VRADVKTEEITIRVDPELAAMYRAASDEQRRKWDLLLRLRLHDVISPHDKTTLEETMREMGRQARANGLTPEILESILNER
jgi:hypothetical protein